MQRKLTYLTIIAVLAITNFSVIAQPRTNLNVTLRGLFNNLTPEAQVSLEETWYDYQRAVKGSPLFMGITTNMVPIDETGTNFVQVITTNHPSMSFSMYFTNGLAQEKIGRVLLNRDQMLHAEMYNKVGKNVVDGWTP